MKKIIAIVVLILLFLTSVHLTVTYATYNISQENPRGWVEFEAIDLLIICALLLGIFVVSVYTLKLKRTMALFLSSIVFLIFLYFAASYVATHNIPVLDPKGWIAVQQRDLIVICILMMSIVVISVFALMILFSWRYQEKNPKGKYAPEWGHSTIGEVIWWGVPFVIIVILAVITWTSTHELNPYKPIDNGKQPLRIQVVALDWKWLFIYPDYGIATVNYVEFPEHTPLNFEITSDAPMNSFWIPELGGQIYAMPAMRTKLHLLANQTGTFRGMSSNISGTGFAGMTFSAVSTSDQDFANWVNEVRMSPNMLTQAEYERLLVPSEYVPVIYYARVDDDLFDSIIMKYMHPEPQQ